jgi:hypothetical protein
MICHYSNDMILLIILIFLISQDDIEVSKGHFKRELDLLNLQFYNEINDHIRYEVNDRAII